MLKIEKSMNGNELVLTLEGRLDTLTSPSLEQAINEDIAKANSILLDMGKLDYISSAGLRILVATDIAMNKKGGMTLKDVQENIMEVFDLTGLADDMKFI